MFYIASKLVWFFATPSNALTILTLAGLVLAAVGRRRRTGLSVAAVGLAMLIVGGLSPLATWIILPLEDRFPAFRDDKRPVAGVIVLGGTFQAREASARGQVVVNEAAERVIAMADLARRYPQARIVFTGGSGALLRNEPSEADILAQHAATVGIEPQRIIFENASRNTFENAAFTRRLTEPKAGERWLLVTSAWHMPRAVGCFRQAGFAVTAYPVDFRTTGPGDRWKTFDTISDGLRRLDLASKEWVGLVAYRAAGYIDSVFPAPL